VDQSVLSAGAHTLTITKTPASATVPAAEHIAIDRADLTS